MSDAPHYLEASSGPIRERWAVQTDALVTLVRYVQPLPDGYFCRNVIRAAMLALMDDMPPEHQARLWSQLKRRLPQCNPPGCDPENEDYPTSLRRLP